MGLASAFGAELDAAEGALASPADDLEPRLAALVARGRTAHPSLVVDGEAFVRHLARCWSRGGEPRPHLEQLAVEDLYLACACLSGVEGAAAGFEVRCRVRLRAVLAAAARSPERRAEVEQRVRDLVLVGTVDAPPKITNYLGQGPLDRWVAVVAQRQAVMLLRGDETEQRARDGAAMEAAIATAQPELAFAKHHYRSDFEHALREALSGLSERDRLLLRLHLVQGLSVSSIGAMYGVAQSTASRWLAEARARVAAQIERALRDRLRLSAGEMASLAALVASQLNVSMSRLLERP
jgi:RNA polymerase sigma-70 factor (ECF subfamily)